MARYVQAHCHATAVTAAPRAEDDSLAVAAAQRRRQRHKPQRRRDAGDAQDEMNDVIGGADLEGEDLHDIGDDCAFLYLFVCLFLWLHDAEVWCAM